MLERMAQFWLQFNLVFVSQKMDIEELQEASLPQQNDFLIGRVLKADDADRHSPAGRCGTADQLDIDVAQTRGMSEVAKSPHFPGNRLIDSYADALRQLASNDDGIGSRIQQSEDSNVLDSPIKRSGISGRYNSTDWFSGEAGIS